MAFDNLGFEDEHATDTGLPDIWTVALTSSGMSTAAFGSSTPDRLPFEAFESEWSSNEDFLFDFTEPVDPLEREQAVYDTAGTYEGVEDFEELWNSNESFLFSRGSVEAASYDTTAPEELEDFEEEWSSNEDFMFDWADVVAGPGVDAADFDSSTPETVEDFEEEWSSNESFHFDRTTVSLNAASYDGETVEDFEEVNVPFVAIADSSTDTLTKLSHGLSDGETVTLSNVGGELPGGLNEGYEYFVVNKTANTFQLSATSGGSAINLTTVGVGTHTVTPDPTVFWVLQMTSV